MPRHLLPYSCAPQRVKTMRRPPQVSGRLPPGDKPRSLVAGLRENNHAHQPAGPARLTPRMGSDTILQACQDWSAFGQAGSGLVAVGAGMTAEFPGVRNDMTPSKGLTSPVNGHTVPESEEGGHGGST
jgi:hypothetical protein